MARADPKPLSLPADRPPNWRNPSAYAFTDTLLPEQWAWEFLRRNPDYQSEWQRFWVTWQALEADYGRAPHRDFTRWQRDPRAYVVVEDSRPGDSCRVSADKVLIECWMGARWGFYKFPLDPAIDTPVIGEQLAWRPVEREARRVGPHDGAYLGGEEGKLALGFDLRLPLREQVELAKRYLQAEQRRQRQEEGLKAATAANLKGRWTLCLRVLDGEAEGHSLDELARTLFGDIDDAGERREAARACLAEAQALRDGGYRRIAVLPGG